MDELTSTEKRPERYAGPRKNFAIFCIDPRNIRWESATGYELLVVEAHC